MKKSTFLKTFSKDKNLDSSYTYKFVICVLFSLFISVAWSQDDLIITSDFYQDSLSQWYDYTTYFQQNITSTSLSEARAAADWMPINSNENIDNKWLKLSIENEQQEAIDLALLLHHSEWTAYWQTEKNIWKSQSGGESIARKDWDSRQHTPVFASPHTLQFNIPAQQTRTFYFKMGKNNNFQSFRPQLCHREFFVAYSTVYFQQTFISQSLFQGALWIMILYHLFLFFGNRQVYYLYYALYGSCIAILLFYSFEMHYFTPLAELGRIVPIIAAYGYYISYLQFIISFLHSADWRNDLRQYLKWLRNAAFFLGVFHIIILWMPIVELKLYNSYFILLIFGALGTIGMIWLSWQYWISKHQLAQRIALTNAFLLLGVAVNILMLSGGISDWLDFRVASFWGIIALEISILIHLLSFAVSLSYKNVETELERTRLEELNRLKSRFFATISHEFRTPLTLILGPIQQLKATINQKSSRQHLQIAETYAQRLLLMVNQILDLAQLEADKLTLKPSVFDLVECCQVMVGSFESMANQQQISLTLTTNVEEKRVFLDREKLEQVLINLIDNAIKYNQSNGKVAVILQIVNQQFDLMVKDTGIGISPEALPHIFQLYYQDTSNSNMHRVASSGIGLALTKELVKLQKGTIIVDSKLGLGTTFTIKLPLPNIPKDIKPTAIAPQLSQLSPKIESPQETPDNETIILLVEDHEAIRAYLQQCLTGYQLLVAKDGKEGWEMAKQHVPDLIITDVMMPEMDGFELTELLKKDVITSHIPIIILTGKSSAESRMEGWKKQADDYLTKPFLVEELQIRVRNLLENRKKWITHFENSSGQTVKKESISLEEQFLQRAKEIVLDNLSDENFNVEQLSRSLHLERTQLFRKLKALTGNNPSYFIRIIRLQQAQQLLQQKNTSVAEIAFAVGFSSTSYFNRSFKNYFGKTPSEVIDEAN